MAEPDHLRSRWTEILGCDPTTVTGADGATCKLATPREGTLSGGVTAPPAHPTLSGGRTAVAPGPGGARASAAAGASARPRLGDGLDLLEEIAQGGMGVIYRAHQHSLRRDIAVKLIRPEKDSPQARAGFIAESLVAGLLDHPNIVPVHELGQTAEGSVYLAMKLVGGTTWKELLHPRSAVQRLAARDSDADRHLAILHNVGNAVAFAHSRGIVHRDLKPENVMVGEFGEVLVMDWGIAVDIREQPGSDSRAVHKSVARPAGTPDYLAPEIADGRGQDIGPWTDTYLLGAILHEVLTGRPPHQGGSVFAKVQAASLSRPPLFGSDVPSGLAAICAKALSQAIPDRFQSVGAFQAALEDFRTHRSSQRLAETAVAALTRATTARPTDTASRTRRFGDFAEAIAGFRQAVALWDGNAAARQGERQARLDYARAALDDGDLGQAEAQVGALDPGDGEVAALGTTVSAARATRRSREAAARRNRWLLAGATAVIVVGLATGIAVVDHERGRTASERDAAVVARKAEAAAAEIARSERAAAVAARTAEAVAAETARSERDAAMVARQAEAASAELARRERADAVAARQAEAAAAQNARTERDAAVAARKAEAAAAETARSERDAAVAARKAEAAASALARSERAEAEKLANAILFDLRDRLQPIGRLDIIDSVQKPVQAYYERRLAQPGGTTADEQRSAAASRLAIGNGKEEAGDLPGALAAFRAGLTIFERLAAQAPHDTDLQRNLSVAHIRIGDVLRNQGDLPAALKACRTALTIRESLIAQEPLNLGWQNDLSVSHNKIGDVLRDQGDLPGAMKAYRAGLVLSERLTQLAPGNVDWQRDLSVSHTKIGEVLSDQRDRPGALVAYRAGLAIRERLAARDARNTTWQRDLTVSYSNIGDVLRAQRDRPGALVAYRAGHAICERLAALDPRNTTWQRDLSVSHNKIGDVLRDQGDRPGALVAYHADLAICERLATQDPSNATWQRDLSIAYERIGNLLNSLGDLPAALIAYRTELVVSQRLAGGNPSNIESHYDLARSHDRVGRLLRRLGDSASATQEMRAGLVISERFEAKVPSDSRWKNLSAEFRKALDEMRR